MMYRLRSRLLSLQGASAMRFQRPSRTADPLPVVHGNMHRIIVVQPPDPMFSEAMFGLKDDYFQTPGLTRQELLRQAKAAAGDCVNELTSRPPRCPLFPTSMSLFALGAASSVLALWIAGII